MAGRAGSERSGESRQGHSTVSGGKEWLLHTSSRWLSPPDCCAPGPAALSHLSSTALLHPHLIPQGPIHTVLQAPPVSRFHPKPLRTPLPRLEVFSLSGRGPHLVLQQGPVQTSRSVSHQSNSLCINAGHSNVTASVTPSQMNLTYTDLITVYTFSLALFHEPCLIHSNATVTKHLLMTSCSLMGAKRGVSQSRTYFRWENTGKYQQAIIPEYFHRLFIIVSMGMVINI